MTYTIICYDDDGRIKDNIHCEYSVDDKVYYIYRNIFGKYKVGESYIDSICFTDMLSYQLENGMFVCPDYISTNLDSMLKRAESFNTKRKLLKR